MSGTVCIFRAHSRKHSSFLHYFAATLSLIKKANSDLLKLPSAFSRASLSGSVAKNIFSPLAFMRQEYRRYFRALSEVVSRRGRDTDPGLCRRRLALAYESCTVKVQVSESQLPSLGSLKMANVQVFIYRMEAGQCSRSGLSHPSHPGAN